MLVSLLTSKRTLVNNKIIKQPTRFIYKQICPTSQTTTTPWTKTQSNAQKTHPMCGILFNIVNRDISTNGDNDSIPAFPPGHVFKCDHCDHYIQKQNFMEISKV